MMTKEKFVFKSVQRCRQDLIQDPPAEAGAFCVCASFYASDNIFESEKKPYVAANSAEGKKNWQAKITPQLSVKLKNGGRLKVGAGGLLEERIVDYSKKSGHNSLEARFSARAITYQP